MDAKLAPLKYKTAKLFRAHQAFVMLVAVLLILVVAIIRINTLSNLPIDQNYISQKKLDIKTVKFNEQAIDQIRQLNESNVRIPGTELPTNRQNPFNE